MKRTFFGLAVSMAMTGALVAAQSAQTPSSSQPSSSGSRDQSPSAASSSSPTNETTITGCLVQGSTSSVYLLQNAKVSGASSAAGSSSGYGAGSSPSARESGSSSSSAAQSDSSRSSQMSAASTLRLDTATGARGVDLKDQVNHQVSITGTFDAMRSTSGSSSGISGSSSAGASGSAGVGSSSSGASGSMAGGSRSSASSTRMDESTMPRFSVKSVTKLADTCSAAG